MGHYVLRAPFLVASAVAAVAGAAISIAPPASAAVGAPTFVQQGSTHRVSVSSATATLTAPVGVGNRLVVETAVYRTKTTTVSAVTDNAGDTFTQIARIVAADKTETAVWTAVSAGGAAAGTIKATASAAGADIGVVAVEYSGLSDAAGSGSVDVTAQRTGRTTTSATVSTGPSATVAAGGELAVGFYADSGFSSSLSGGSGFAVRANVSPNSDMQLLTEDRSVASGATPGATATAGASTTWSMIEVVFRTGAPAAPTVPGAPTNVVALAGDTTATLSWTAAPSGGASITTYTITPYVAGAAQPTSIVTGNPPATSATVTGLVDGTSYTFTVRATNSVGIGPESDASNAVVPSANDAGSWSDLQTWPIAPLAMHVLYTGKTVSWDGWQQPQPTVAWDPTQPTSFPTVNAPDSVFCDGAADLPDGRLLVIGGYGKLKTGDFGIVDTNIYDPATGTWSRVADMHYPRWYPTLTELSDGRYLALSGNTTDANTWADTPEVYDPTTNSWTLLTHINTSSVHEVEYPFTYEVPSGKVFVIGPEEDNSHLLDADAQTWTSTGSSGLFNGSSVMYRPGKILYSGGAALINTPTPAKATTAVIDTNVANPTWRQTAPMHYSRIYHTLTMLADGTVLSVGGSNTSDQQVITSGVLPTEIWNPDTEKWTDSAPIATARNYHSTAVLLPDARVLVGGGGHSEGLQDAAQYSSQIYTPGYLNKGPRPTITSAPAAATYGATMPVSTPDAASITSVNLVSLAADTHQIDMNQHFVPLSFTSSGGTLNVRAPADSATAPPGYYMLFVLKNGVPSVAKMVNIGSAQSQTVPAKVTGVVASAGNGSASVSWTAPNSGNTPITSYRVTPYISGVAQTPTVVDASNPSILSTTVRGLTNGTVYTFTVAATNAVGTGPQSAASQEVTPSTTPAPTFIQSTTAQAAGVTTLPSVPDSPITAGDRMIVEVGAWSNGHAITTSVTDSAGNTYTKLAGYTASEGTDQSVWSAPITAGGGTRPTITATTSNGADVALAALEYSGLSTASGTAALDVQSHATGRTAAAATIASGATPAASAGNELALGFYADSGFGNPITGGAGFTSRANVSPNDQLNLAVEDRPVGAGATPSAAFGTGANTVWQAATLIFAAGSNAAPTAPAAPTNIVASPGNASAGLSWTAPANGGSPVTGYTVTTYAGSTASGTKSVPASATSTTITGLSNGTSYNFAVTATNAVGTGPMSTLSNTVVPTAAAQPQFVQQVSARGANVSSLGVTPTAALAAGNRLVVEVGVWNQSHPTTSAVTDSAGDSFTELDHFTGSDGTEMSIWSALVGAGAGARPKITATTTGTADIGVAALEYSGIAATSPVDVAAHATGTTTSAQLVSSGLTAETSSRTGLAIGFYVDSGFNSALTSDAGYRSRVNVSPFSDMQLLVEDQVVTAGATPSASIRTGARTVWLAETLVLSSG